MKHQAIFGKDYHDSEGIPQLSQAPRFHHWSQERTGRAGEAGPGGSAGQRPARPAGLNVVRLAVLSTGRPRSSRRRRWLCSERPQRSRSPQLRRLLPCCTCFPLTRGGRLFGCALCHMVEPQPRGRRDPGCAQDTSGRTKHGDQEGARASVLQAREGARLHAVRHGPGSPGCPVTCHPPAAYRAV